MVVFLSLLEREGRLKDSDSDYKVFKLIEREYLDQSARTKYIII